MSVNVAIHSFSESAVTPGLSECYADLEVREEYSQCPNSKATPERIYGAQPAESRKETLSFVRTRH